MKLFNILVFGLIYAPSVQSAASDWYVASTGTPTASVGTTGSSIQLTYDIVDRARTVSVFALDCITPVDPLPTLSESTGAVSVVTNRRTLTLDIALDQDVITTSNIWTASADGTTGSIKLCVRVDVLDGVGGTSYNFNEQKLTVGIDLTKGFAVNTIDVNRDVADVNANAATEYGITTCQCDENSVCSTATLTQGSAAAICIVTTPNSGVLISSVKDLKYALGSSYGFDAITGGTNTATTDVVNQDTSARIATQIPSSAFDTSLIGFPLVGTGTIVVTFGSGRARNLRFAIGNSASHVGGSASRMMQAQKNETQTAFSVSMALASPEPEEPPKAEANTGVLIGGIVGAIAGVAIIVALVLAARRKKGDDKKEEATAGSIAGSIISTEVDKKEEVETCSIVAAEDDMEEICA
jgi:hypothetical protein